MKVRHRIKSPTDSLALTGKWAARMTRFQGSLCTVANCRACKVRWKPRTLNRHHDPHCPCRRHSRLVKNELNKAASFYSAVPGPNASLSRFSQNTDWREITVNGNIVTLLDNVRAPSIQQGSMPILLKRFRPSKHSHRYERCRSDMTVVFHVCCLFTLSNQGANHD